MTRQSSSGSTNQKAKRSSKKSASSRIPDFNQIRAKIREIAKTNKYDEEILLSFAEFINGGEFKSIEPKMQDLKNAVIKAFGYSSYAELSKDGAFSLFVKDHNLRMTNTEAWLKVYRKFVGLPESERNSIGKSSINGINVLRNFLPWDVFDLDPEKATAEDIKAAFNKIAKKHHPDHGGDPAVFEELKIMRDTLLSAY
ncbi:J domain-containing protein [Leptolyngbya sp. BL0902]|uniref:J domain-containing protein n=1 Tax=Leptolyngbya sp. BL0902 TaxID=1115757 RepID=UPI0018E7E68A|nr:J domain-containing protein [Leptolyngbya sp. BL0902]